MARPMSTLSSLSHVTEHTERTSASHVTGTSRNSGVITPAHKTWTAYEGPVLYSGPSGLRDQRVKTKHDFLAVGENDKYSEITNQICYLNRPNIPKKCPSGLRDQRVNTKHDFQAVGENDKSSEITNQICYLNRPPPGAGFPKAKHGQVGEIGWVYDSLKVVKGI